MPTTAEYLNDLVAQRESLVEALTDAGVEASSEETFSTLVPKAKDKILYDKALYNALTNGGRCFAYLFYEVSGNGTNNMDHVSSIPEIDTSNGVWFQSMFSDCCFVSKFPSIDISKARNINSMFYGCGAMSRVPDGFTLPPTVTSLNSLFYGCSVLKELPELDYSYITSASNWIAYSGVERLGNMNLHSLTSLNSVFANAKKLKTIESLECENITSATMTFDSCISLEKLPIMSFPKLGSVDRTFRDCSTLHTISGLNISGATSIPSTAFERCSSLANLAIIGSIKVSITLSACPLTVESAKSVINALVDYSGTANAGKYTVAFSQTTLDLLAEEGATAPNGVTWLEYTSSKGWNI